MKKLLPIGIALAIIIYVIYSFKQWFFPTPNPTKTFTYLIANPIPSSVTSIHEGNSIAMDSVFRVLSFQINNVDLKTILDSQHFTPIDENQEFKKWDLNSKQEIKISKADYLNSWKQRIQKTVKLDVNFSNSWQIFILKEGNVTKYFSSIQTAQPLCLLRMLTKMSLLICFTLKKELTLPPPLRESCS